MSGRDDLLQLLSSRQSYSIYYWISILNLFSEHESEFTISDMRLLVAECEDIREWFNKNNVDKIRKNDTKPNVYKHLAMLEKEAHQKFLREQYKEESPSTVMVAMAQ